MIDALLRARKGTLLATSAVLLAAAFPAGANATTCNSSAPCAVYQNSNGIGIQGVSSKSTGIEGQTKNTSGSHAALLGVDLATNGGVNDGVLGTVTNGGWGVAGTSGNGAYGGVFGSATQGFGVKGTSVSSVGTYGTSTSYIGVLGASTSSIGSFGESASSDGVYGTSTSGFGVQGASSSNDGGHFTSGSGTGLAAISSSGDALYAVTGGGIGAYIHNSSGNGSDITGSYIGVIGRSDQFPLVLTNQAGSNLFYVTGGGDVYVHGNYHTFAQTRSGQAVMAFSSSTTTQNVEDVGSAQLHDGTANVRLDPALAASIDMQSAYHVFLTPNGDTRGLFVASKTPTGFTVRETQSGHGNVSFDYRIVGAALGHAHERMALVNAVTSSPRTSVVIPRTIPAVIVPKLPQAKNGASK